MRWVVNSEQAKYMRQRQEQNKNKAVKAEIWAKQRLKASGYKWNRQTIWGCRLFDFWCHELGIAVEIDGLTHDKNYDKARDEYNFYRSGIVVLRVPNFDEVAMGDAIKQIKASNTWEIRKLKMREEFGLRDEESFSSILKKVGLKKAHGKWQPSFTPERTQKALDLASEIGFHLTDQQVSQAMAMVEKRLEVGHEH